MRRSFLFLAILFQAGVCFGTETIIEWTPDTCDSVIQYAADSENPQAAPRFVKFVKPCSRLAGLSDAVMYATILAENRMKNYSLDKINKFLARAEQSLESYSYDNSGVLVLKFNNLTAQEKNSLQTLVNNEYGAGKINIL